MNNKRADGMLQSQTICHVMKMENVAQEQKENTFLVA